MRKYSPLGIKFVVMVATILSLTLLISSSWFVQQQKSRLHAQLTEQGNILGDFLAHVSVDAILSFDFVALESYVKDINKRQDIVFSVIIGDDGNPLTSHIDYSNPLVRSLASGDKFESTIDLLHRALQSRSIMIQTYPIMNNNAKLGNVIIGLNRGRLERETIDYFLLELSIYTIIILFLSAAIFMVFRSNVLLPINKLVGGAHRIASGNYDEPVDIVSSDEIGELAKTFNDMMAEVRKDRDLLNFQANYDSLTGLPNRVQAAERLRVEIHRAEREHNRFAIIFVDLNNFKYVNDTMGHLAGDKLLGALSKRFKSVLRDSDIIARLGGDEFLVILPTATRPATVKEVAQRLIDSLDDAIFVDEHEVFIRCSMGIAIYPTDGTSAEELMANADNAMYQSKLPHTGDISFFAPELGQAIKERMELEHDLHLALEQQQFKLHFQPIVDADKKTIIGAEALLRWHHPDRGIVHPLSFIPIAESTGRIIQIGRWALNNALATIRDLLEQGIDPGFITVNVSRLQLTKEFEGTVQSALNYANLPPSRLRLEVTESALMEHYGELPDMLRRLDTLGVRLILDDFGTGYSSLNYLKHFPFHTLKIDKSFIDNVPDSEDDASLVRGIIAMGRSLGLNVVSEGVEREEQYHFLVGSGVDSMQGYLFARPMSMDDFIAFMRKNIDSANTPESTSNSKSRKSLKLPHQK